MKYNREGFLETDTHRECTACGEIFQRWGKVSVYCKPCNSTRVKSYDREWRMWSRAKQRAKAHGREFTLQKSDIVIPELCPILGIPLVTHSGQSGGRPNSPALDRFDSTKGYTSDNIWVISQRANQMKADAGVQELKLFAAWVLNNL
jgi:hypothetical protein